MSHENKCYACGYEWVTDDDSMECPTCAPKERLEKRQAELWELLEFICGKREEGSMCGHLSGPFTCHRENCPALKQAEKVLETFIKDIR